MSPTRNTSNGRRRTTAEPVQTTNDLSVSPQGRRRRRSALLVLILLLMLGSFWIGRASFQAPTPAEIPAPALAPPPIASTAQAPAQAAEPAKPAVTLAAAAAASAPAVATAAATARSQPETTLLEVSVGTTSRGGLTLKFDHPVDWKVNGPAGGAHAELDVQGVRALGTFPRNLPLPPGAAAIHAGITAPDTLNLRFDLRPGVRAHTFPEAGPTAAVNIYFRTAAEESLAPSLPPGLQAAAGCGASATPQVAKAMSLLQQSLSRNPGYAEVRAALALLETCAGDGAKAQQLLEDGMKGSGGVRLAVADATLRYARGDADGALKVLKSNAPPGNADADYLELTADLLAAKQP